MDYNKKTYRENDGFFVFNFLRTIDFTGSLHKKRGFFVDEKLQANFTVALKYAVERRYERFNENIEICSMIVVLNTLMGRNFAS
ncbi:hypothetical protein [Flavobacterium sp. SM2513]|uniref:hypothetical protein n=1 Tax=Flavobacterium sp. SM2513 TaxID=3424766 RepID=UPI003D7F81BC